METKTVHKFNFKSHEYRNDPWKVYGKLCQEGPIVRIKMPFFGTCWAASNFESVNEVFKNDDQFVRDPKNAGRKTVIPYQWMLPRVFNVVMHNMLGADRKDHRRLRSLVDKAFAHRNIDNMSEHLDLLSREQLEIAASVAARDGKVDLIEHFMRPFPLTAICELLGLPPEDRPKFRAWFEPLSKVSSVFGMFSIGMGMRGKKFVKYFRSQFEEVRKNPREGLMSELVQIQHEGERLSEDELMSMAFLLLVAGHETTVHLISNAVLTLLQQPQAKQELLNDWSKIDGAIEEVLRYASPLQMAKPRYVVRDLDFYGEHLRQGELIIPLIACANYDPERFENPNEFDIDRPSNYHMTFGSGPHTCLGIKLARAETHYALKNMFARWPNLKPEFDLNQPDWSFRPGTRGMKTMFVSTG